MVNFDVHRQEGGGRRDLLGGARVAGPARPARRIRNGPGLRPGPGPGTEHDQNDRYHDDHYVTDKQADTDRKRVRVLHDLARLQTAEGWDAARQCATAAREIFGRLGAARDAAVADTPAALKSG